MGGKLPNHLNPGSETNVVQVVKVVLHVIVMVETETRTDVEVVVVVMHAWTREVPETTSNQSSVVEWEVLEEVVVDHQVVGSVLLHLPVLEDSVLHHQAKDTSLN